ncbi:MAG: hypothetical protein QXO68_00475 [Conexivisphaerales archaeon]
MAMTTQSHGKIDRDVTRGKINTDKLHTIIVVGKALRFSRYQAQYKIAELIKALTAPHGQGFFTIERLLEGFHNSGRTGGS